jgi:trehalose-6-phosphate synthase
MRLTIRVLAAIWLSAMVVAGAFAYVSVRTEKVRLTQDLERRAWLLGEGLRDSLEPVLVRGGRGMPDRMDRLLRRFGSPARGLAVYDGVVSLLAATPDVSADLPVLQPVISETLTTAAVHHGLERSGARTIHYYALPLSPPVAADDRPAREGRTPPPPASPGPTPGPERPIGVLVVVQDAGYVDERFGDVVRFNLLRFLALVVAISIITILVIRWSVTHPLQRLAEWARDLRRGEATSSPPPVTDPAIFGPLATEMTGLAASLVRARAAAEEEARLRLEGQSVWTEERLRQVVTGLFGDQPIFVVSNREPYQHVHRGRQIEVLTPPSGLVTALDPVMRACGGVWVAHGSGDADREVVDNRDEVKVPPDEPRYSLKRVWLSENEEKGYYVGFANEGLWPLCHIVHARPIFRPEDWAQYEAVNEKFALAVLQAMEDTESPVLLIQDYHFARLAAHVRRRRPDARIALFWHIPWPNPEAFGICPWQSELLEGMLGADIVGFHTQFHCNNFLETVDRAIETRIDWEHFSVVRGQHTTVVKPFPISVAPAFVDQPPPTTRETLQDEIGVHTEFMAVGVERLDYTKGLPERFRAVGRFLDQHPDFRGRVTFVQIAAPSRGQIPRYRELADEVDRIVEEVNHRHGTRDWRPIVMLKGQHSHRGIWPFYRWADVCLVTSLHDGMNLVAKEFVSVRDDGDGVLVLSRFTGAARELRDAALVVNPYDVDALAEAIHQALVMPPGERRSRMARMRHVVRGHNIYRWAGLLLSELASLPVTFEHAGRG